MLVVVEVIRTGVVGDVQVGPSVIVVVAPDHSQPVVAVYIFHARFLRNFLEGAVAAIVEEQVRFADHAPGAALDQDSLEAAILLVAAEGGQVVHIEMHVARNVEVHEAVAIVVGPGGSGAEAAGGHAGFVGDVFKFAIAQVAVERVAAETGDVDVRQTVVVEVGDGHAHAPAFARQTRGRW